MPTRPDVELTLAASLQDFVQGLNKATQTLSGSLSEMRGEAKRGTDRINQAFRTLDLRSFDEIERDIDRTRAAYKQLARDGSLSSKQLAQAQVRMTERVRELRREAGTLGDAFGQIKGELLGASAAIYGVVRAVTAGARKFGDFNLRMAEVNTIARRSKQDLASMSEEVRQLAIELGKDPSELAAALYDIVSAGVDSSRALNVLRASSRSAIAGLTDTKNAAQLGLGILNAYGKEVGDLGEVYDLLFQTVKNGVTTFPELAQSVGDVLPSATAANVELSELTAAIATLTSQGTRTPQAITGLKGAINALAAPTDSAKKAFDKLNISYEGLTKTLGDIAALDLSVAELRELIPDVEARNAVITLTNAYEKLRGNLEGMRDSAGATGEAYDIISDTPSRSIDELKASFGELTTSLGQAAAAFTPVVESLTGVINAFNRLPQAVRVSVVGFAGLVGLITPLVLVAVKARNAFRLLGAQIGEKLARHAGAGGAALKSLGGSATGASAAMTRAAGAARLLGTAVRGIAFVTLIAELVRVVDLLGDLRDAQKEAAAAAEEAADAQQHAAEQIRQAKTDLADYAQVAIEANDAVIEKTHEQAQAYFESLQNAAKYWRAVAVQQGLNSEASEEARQKAKQYEAALAKARKTLQAYNAEERKRAERILAVGRAIDEAIEAGKTASDAISDSLEDVKDKSVEAFGAVLQGLDNYARYSEITGQRVREGLGGALEDLSGEQLDQFERRARLAFENAALSARGLERAIRAVASARLDRLGIDLDAIERGFTDAEAAAVDSVNEIIKALDDLGIEGEKRAAAFVAGVEGQIEKLSSIKALEAFEQRIQEAYSEGEISARSYYAALAQLQAKQRELNAELDETRGKGNVYEEIERGARGAADAAEELNEETEKTPDRFEKAQEAAKGAAQQIAGLITQWTDLGGTVAESMNAIVRNITTKGESLIGFNRKLARGMERLSQAFNESAAQADKVIEAFDSGAKSAFELEGAARAAASSVQTLDQQRLDKLQHIIQQARREMEEFRETVTDVLADSERRLLEFQGKRRELAVRESEERIQELETLLQQAPTGSDERRKIRQAIENERRLLELRLRQIETEERAQREREREAQQHHGQEMSRIEERRQAGQGSVRVFEETEEAAQRFHANEMHRIDAENQERRKGVEETRRELESIVGPGGLAAGGRIQQEHSIDLRVMPVERPGVPAVNLSDGQLQEVANRLMDVIRRSRGNSTF